MLAFFIVDGIAIAAGSWVTNVVPIQTVKIASGILFIVFGIITLLRKEKETEQKKFYSNPFMSGFLLIFLAEWGDKTQIASALFAAKYNALLVLLGTIGGLFLVSVTAVYCGMFLADHIKKNVLKKVSAVIFIIMGIVFFF
jgi:putative Ca2+/H+ antiporter (TMEM165/GDT1 family)